MLPSEHPALEPTVAWPSGPALTDPPAPRFIAVSGDVPAWVAPGYGESTRVIVYLHGLCGDPIRASEWARSAQRFGTLISLRGDTKCKTSFGHFFRSDPTYLDYRIKKAIRSVSSVLERSLDEEDVVLVGYSQGAERAEDLGWLFSGRYSRIALMSGPSAPHADKTAKLDALAIVRGGKEYQKTYREAAIHIDRAGIPTRFFQLPGAVHGEFGRDAPRVMNELFEHLLR